MTTKLFSFLLSALFLSSSLLAQRSTEPPEFQLQKSELEAHLRFLASDELQGRRTGEMGNNIAARYIAAQLEAYGLKPAPGLKGYYQPVSFQATTPPTQASLLLNKAEYKQGDGLLILLGNAQGIKTDAVFANYGWADEKSGYDDYKGLNVKGKIVFVLPGTPEAQDPMAVFTSMSKKRKLAQEQGAVALIELYRLQ
ncbi:MAG TPA: peptidase M28, partial [Saprospiraceae bacterium]|nr:peptidase M28 [Saprospiraceae bacterium]